MNQNNFLVRYFANDPMRFRVFSFFSILWIVPLFFWALKDALAIEYSSFLNWNAAFLHSRFWIAQPITNFLGSIFDDPYRTGPGVSSWAASEGSMLFAVIPVVAYGMQMICFGIGGLILYEAARSIFFRLRRR